MIEGKLNEKEKKYNAIYALLISPYKLIMILLISMSIKSFSLSDQPIFFLIYNMDYRSVK
jgi:hypothetical protein